jgi:hypothetical protein
MFATRMRDVERISNVTSGGDIIVPRSSGTIEKKTELCDNLTSDSILKTTP